MRKVMKYLAAVSLITFIIAWGVGGINILDHDFDNFAWVYVGAVAFVVFFCSFIFLRTVRCSRCGRFSLTSGAYCPYCGNRIK